MTQIYEQLAVYPTRDGTAHILATWNSQPVSLDVYYWAKIFVVPESNTIAINDGWNKDDANPFSDCGAILIANVTEQATDGALAETFISAGVYSGYRPLFAVCYRTTEMSGRGYYCTWRYTGATIGSNFITSAAPSLSYSDGTLTIGTCCAGRRVLEFRRTDTAYGGSTGITDEATLNEAFYAALLNMERSNPYQGYYDLANNPILYRWAAGRYTVGVNFISSTNQSRISAAIDSALSQINAVLNSYGVSFARSGTSGDITVTVDSEDALFPNRGSTTYGGTWSTTKTSAGIITGATVKLANDFQDYSYYISYESVALEELLQCMGAGYDQVEYPFDTTHTDFNYYNKSSAVYDRDANILRLIYSSAVSPGDKYYEVCRKLNIPKGCYMPGASMSNSIQTVRASGFLTPGGTYQVRAFIVDGSGMVSGTSDWITITVPEAYIEPWSWSASNGSATATQTQQFYNVLRGTALPESGFSHLVWNDLVDKASEVVTACGDSWYSYERLGVSGCKVSSGDAFPANKYNEVRYNLGSIISTGISDKFAEDEIFGYYVTTLTDTINAIISTVL